MPRKKTITSAALAVKDLDAIRTWYADQQVPAVGEKLLREIRRQTENTTLNLYIGRNRSTRLKISNKPLK